MSSIQERLAAFITVVGGDIKTLNDRTAKIPPPYAAGAPAGGSDKDLAIRTDDIVPPNAAAGDNPGLWQKQGAAYVRVAPRVKHADNHVIGGVDPLYLPQYDRDLGYPGVIAPMPIFSSGSAGMTANRAYFVRFVTSRAMNIALIGFSVTVASATDDPVDVGIYDSTLANKLASSGATTGKLLSNGLKTVALSVALAANTVYYAAFAANSTASLGMTSFITNSNLGIMFGTTAPLATQTFKNTAYPLPAGPIVTAGAIINCPILTIRES